jgi:hypothetical protein
MIIMKKLFIYIITAITLTSCEKFLDKTPSEGGIESFSDASQFDALLNEIRITRNRYEWNHAILASDDLHFHPDFQTANPSGYQQREAFNIWNEAELRNQTGPTNGFIGPFTYMYTFNYITDRIDGPSIGGSDLLKKQVKAEAMFFRALYYFCMAVQYTMHPALNNGEYPGLGYKNTISTTPETYNDRKTVKYTFDKILEDLKASEAMLLEVGKTDFNIRQPWRPTVVTVQSLRARVELYMGNYQTAFQYAKKAYDAYNFLYDMNNTTLFTMVNRGTVQTETVNGVTYSVFPQSPAILTNAGNTVDPESNSFYYYKEAYFRFTCQLAAANKLPPSQDLYNLYDTADLRKKIWYDNNMNINTASLFKPSRKDQLVSKSYMKHATSITGSGYLLAVTVPEIMLILAECRARGAGDGENASVILKQLRKTRFPATYADKIGGTLKDVKDERRRELSFTMRWYDLKRYNALDNDNIVIRKLGRRDVYQLSSDLVTWVLQPNAPAYALPIPQVEVDLLGWKQNEYGGVSAQ